MSDRTLFVASVESKKLYDRLSMVGEGEVVSYAALNEAAVADVRRQAKSALRTARKNVAEELDKYFDAIPGVGLRCCLNGEKARSHAKATSVVRGVARRCVAKTTSCDYGRLSTEEKLQHNTGLAVMSVLASSASNQNVKRIQGAVTAAGVPPLSDVLRLTLEHVAGEGKK